MLRRTLLFVMIIIGIFIAPLVTSSQQPVQLDFPKEQVEEANKQLDSFLEKRSRVPFKITDEYRKIIISRYLGETDRSSYFWKYLGALFEDSFRPLMPCRNCADVGMGYLNESEREQFIMSIVRTRSWGILILSSEPSGADVSLKVYVRPTRVSEEYFYGLTKEGQTVIRRKYPEGKYTFVVEMNGYKSKEVEVNINKNNPVEETVSLEKQ